MSNTVDEMHEHSMFKAKGSVKPTEGQEALLTVLECGSSTAGIEANDAEFTSLASEETLARIWNDPIEDEAWEHL